ncbi:TPA: MFS transporter [Klebsiella pneumoniae]
MQNSDNSSLEQVTIKKVWKRLIPFIFLLYLINFLDRTNVSFAAIHMNKDIGLTQTIYGLGAGLFFLGYVIFEIPSNILLHKFGARIWIARIMITWGIIAALMAFIHNSTQFITLRVLLGIAEAGFFPGILFYLSLWFPSSHRARAIGWLYIGAIASQVIGAPLSGGLIELGDTLGFTGWRVMYLIEAVPALILGIICIFYLTDEPSKSKWLNAEERNWLVDEMRTEVLRTPGVENKKNKHSSQIRDALLNKEVWSLALIYLGLTCGLNAMLFFLPSVIHSLSFGNSLNMFQTGLIAAIPYTIAGISTIYWSKRSDQKKERHIHSGGAAILSSCAIVIAVLQEHPLILIGGFIIMAASIYCAINVFWAIPTQALSGLMAATGIGLINSIGNFSGFLGPYITGYLNDKTGSYSYSFTLFAVLTTASGISLILKSKKSKTVNVKA